MKGTPTIGKAKSLKEKRELAAELGTFLALFSHLLCSHPHHSGLCWIGISWQLADPTDEVREFEAKRGVNDLETEERASRSKDRKSKGRRSVVEEDTDEEEEEEEDRRVKGNVSVQC